MGGGKMRKHGEIKSLFKEPKSKHGEIKSLFKPLKNRYGVPIIEKEEEHQETPSEKLHREEEERKAYWNDYWNNKAQPCIID